MLNMRGRGWLAALAAVIILYSLHLTGLISKSLQAVQSSSFTFSSYEDATNSTQKTETSQTGAEDSEENDGGNYNGLSDLCRETQWTEGLWLHCHSYCGENETSVCGGLNNARNRIQTCLRLAIDTGAGIILPSATTRDEKNLVATNSLTVCPDVFWDIEHLQKTLKLACPQLQMRMCDDRSGIEHEIPTPHRAYMEFAHHQGTFRELVVEAAMQESGIKKSDISASNQAAISYGDSYIGWNYRDAGELTTIRKGLFKALRFNRDLLNLSSYVSESEQLQSGAYIGVHLRGESDWPGGFGSVDDQMRLYTQEIESIRTSVSQDIKVVYVSCGDAGAIQRFRDMLSPLGFTVEDKSTILSKQPLLAAKVKEMPFDAKAIVEYETLVRGKFWMGLIMSSMSSLVAYARTVDDEHDFFDTHVFPGSSKSGTHRGYPEAPVMKGNQFTKLMVVNGVDIMDYFP